MKIKKINSKIILQYFAIFFACVILANAEISSLNPFVFTFFFACLFVGFDEKLISIFTISSAVLIIPTLEQFFISLTVVGVGLISFYIHKLLKKNIHVIVHFITYLISLTTYIYYNYAHVKNLIFYIVLGCISLYVMIVVLQGLILNCVICCFY